MKKTFLKEQIQSNERLEEAVKESSKNDPKAKCSQALLTYRCVLEY